MGKRKKRDFMKEHDQYFGPTGSTASERTPIQNRRRKEKTARNRVRRRYIAKHGKGSNKGKDIHHINGNALDDRPSNLKLVSKAWNRSRNKQ